MITTLPGGVVPQAAQQALIASIAALLSTNTANIVILPSTTANGVVEFTFTGANAGLLSAEMAATTSTQRTAAGISWLSAAPSGSPGLAPNPEEKIDIEIIIGVSVGAVALVAIIAVVVVKVVKAKSSPIPHAARKQHVDEQELASAFCMDDELPRSPRGGRTGHTDHHHSTQIQLSMI